MNETSGPYDPPVPPLDSARFIYDMTITPDWTFALLARYVQQLAALDVPGNAEIRVTRKGWRGRLRKLTVGPRGATGPAIELGPEDLEVASKLGDYANPEVAAAAQIPPRLVAHVLALAKMWVRWDDGTFDPDVRERAFAEAGRQLIFVLTGQWSEPQPGREPEHLPGRMPIPDQASVLVRRATAADVPDCDLIMPHDAEISTDTFAVDGCPPNCPRRLWIKQHTADDGIVVVTLAEDIAERARPRTRSSGDCPPDCSRHDPPLPPMTGPAGPETPGGWVRPHP